MLSVLAVVVATQATGAIDVDGVHDDAAWQAASWVEDFAQKEPEEGAPPTDTTAVAIAFDGDAIYVAARMTLTDPAALDRPMTRRDETTGAERFIVSFDPYRSRRTAYSFAVTAAGVRADWIHTDDDEHERDLSWNPVWRAAISVGADAWTAEMRIPLSQLRFPDDDVKVWGVNFNRYVPRTGEDDFWIVVPKDVTAWASYFGELRGLEVEQQVRLELLPYVATDVAIVEGEATPGASAGIDVKVGLGPSLTLDATINPDFGQVEADPAVVVLDAFEVQLPERRPFFIEGAQIFASNPRGYFYSRRIGAGARILGAAKLTGQAASRTNVGALAALTLASGDAPATGWTAARVERELGDGGVLGALVTGVGRDDDPMFTALYPRGAMTGGVDLLLRPRGGEYEIFAAVGGSAITGEAPAIAEIQRSSAHYFQRPDADHVELDPDATSLRGWHADLAASRRAGDWRFETLFGAESPGLELDDIGLLQSADDLVAETAVSRVVTEPTRYLHGWSLTLRDREAWNFGGAHKPGETYLVWNATLPGFIGFELGTGVARPGVDDDLTRGGPLAGRGWNGEIFGAINSSHAGALDWGANLGVADGDELTGVQAGASVLWRAMDRLRFALAPSVTAGTIWKQYVATVEGTAGGGETFGARYVFALLDLRQASVQLRAQLSLSPDLTVDGYVEPFLSRGRFVGFGELPRPRARDLRRYESASRTDGVVTVDDGGDVFTFEDPDFEIRSLRSTVVVRWELRPGSTGYAVWQHDSDRGDVVALKLAYWWSP